jgi:hypothetical protein
MNYELNRTVVHVQLIWTKGAFRFSSSSCLHCDPWMLISAILLPRVCTGVSVEKKIGTNDLVMRSLGTPNISE